MVSLAIVRDGYVKANIIPFGRTANTAFAGSGSRGIGDTITGLSGALVMPDDMHRSADDRLFTTE